MAGCATCGKTIVFGGVREGTQRYCSERCRAADALGRAASQVPAELVQDAAGKVRRGPCPRCGGRRGPVDLHLSHRVYSMLVLTRWESRPVVACRPCATRQRLLDTLFSLCLGWWGIPWGIFLTPVQVGRNVVALLSPQREGPAASPALEAAVRRQIAAQALASGGPPRMQAGS